MHKGWLTSALVATLLGVLVCSGSASAASTGDLSGIVFADADSDGTFGEPDVPLAHFALSVSGPNSGCAPTCAHPTSDNSGSFHLTGLPAGDYTIRLNGGYMCVDPLRTNWLGEYIQGFCTHGGIDVPVTVEAGEETNVLVPLTGFIGHLGGRLWLDGVPPPAGTPIVARGGHTICASTTTATRQMGDTIVVSEFSLIFGRACIDGDISLFAGDREFAQTTGERVWQDAFDSWNYADNYFSTHEYHSPAFFPFFASLSGNSKLVSIRAVIGDVVCGAATGKGAVFGLVVLPDELRPGCGVVNSPVSICIGRRLADKTVYWSAGETYFPSPLQTTDSPCPVPVRMGDGNCDGDVTLADVTDGLAAAVEGDRLPCTPEANTDCAGDATVSDLLPVLAYLAGVAPPGSGNCPAIGEAQT